MHKSGRKSYPPSKGHPGKGMHKMPSGKMMPNNVIKKHQRKTEKKKGY